MYRFTPSHAPSMITQCFDNISIREHICCRKLEYLEMPKTIEIANVLIFSFKTILESYFIRSIILSTISAN